MSLRIEVENYRTLKKADWEPSGVCAVVGPNGSGKTTLLRVLPFLRNVYMNGVLSAVGFVGGNWGLRHLAAEQSDPVRLRVKQDEVVWTLDLVTSGASVDERCGESLHIGGELVGSRKPLSERYDWKGEESASDERCMLRAVYDITRDPRLERIVRLLKQARIYENYHLYAVQTQPAESRADFFLHPTGRNLFSVLRTWRDRRADARKYRFVIETMRKALPDLFTDLSFDVFGNAVSAAYQHPKYDMPLPIHVAPNGLIVGLLHTTAVAGGEPGGYLAIDELENALHPHAIRVLVRAFREWSDETDLAVAVATHSPVLLDEFNKQKEDIFVMQPGKEVQPVRVTELAEPEWLDQFALGRLYTGGDIGSPNSTTPKQEPTAA